LIFPASFASYLQASVAFVPCPIRELLPSHIEPVQTIQRTLIASPHRMQLSLLSRGEDTQGHCTLGYRKNQGEGPSTGPSGPSQLSMGHLRICMNSIGKRENALTAIWAGGGCPGISVNAAESEVHRERLIFGLSANGGQRTHRPFMVPIFEDLPPSI
jgi:hypothetical protein